MLDVNLSALSDRAWSLVEMNRMVEARSLFKQICEIDESDPESWMMLGSLHAELSEDEEAISCLNKALDHDPAYPDAHYNLAKVLVKQRHLPDAQNHCQIALNNDSAYAAAWQLMGAIQETFGNFVESERCSRKAIELAPDNAISHANLALSLWKQDKLEESVQSFQRSLDLNSQQADVWLQLAVVYTRLHLYVDAERCCEKVILIDPEAWEAYELLGNILSAQGRVTEKIDICRKALRIKSTNVGILLQLGNALYINNQRDAAENAFREVIRLDPENAKAYFGLGVVFNAKGLKKEEIENIQHALSLEPENEQYQYYLACVTGVDAPTMAPASHVRDLFDTCAENFDSHLIGRLSYLGPEKVHEAAMGFLDTTAGKDLDILDLGCGTGLCAPLFRPLARSLSGIDLSGKMIDIARKRNLYDQLIIGDISAVLEGVNDRHDIVIATDVFVYIGDLKRVFELCSVALKSSGLFVFTVEAAKNETVDFVLETSGRYSHSRQYLTALAMSVGLEVASLQNSVLRMESGNPINSYVVVMRQSRK